MHTISVNPQNSPILDNFYTDLERVSAWDDVFDDRVVAIVNTYFNPPQLTQRDAGSVFGSPIWMNSRMNLHVRDELQEHLSRIAKVSWEPRTETDPGESLQARKFKHDLRTICAGHQFDDGSSVLQKFDQEFFSAIGLRRDQATAIVKSNLLIELVPDNLKREQAQRDLDAYAQTSDKFDKYDQVKNDPVELDKLHQTIVDGRVRVKLYYNPSTPLTDDVKRSEVEKKLEADFDSAKQVVIDTNAAATVSDYVPKKKFLEAVDQKLKLRAA
jgi:hypothetical protein